MARPTNCSRTTSRPQHQSHAPVFFAPSFRAKSQRSRPGMRAAQVRFGARLRLPAASRRSISRSTASRMNVIRSSPSSRMTASARTFHRRAFSSTRRPASVIFTRATSILREPATTRSAVAVASFACTSSTISLIVKPCARRMPSAQPSSPQPASSSSARTRSGLKSRLRVGWRWLGIGSEYHESCSLPVCHCHRARRSAAPEGLAGASAPRPDRCRFSRASAIARKGKGPSIGR